MGVSELVGLLGILLGLSLLIWLAFRAGACCCWRPIAAMVAALLSGEPLLAHWTQTFMRSASLFLAQFFPIFLLGALFGKLMEDTRLGLLHRRLHDRKARDQTRHSRRRARPARSSPMAASACSSPSS